MASVAKDGTIYSIGEGQQIVMPNPDPEIPDPVTLDTVMLGVLIAQGTPGEQRVMFMMLETDYEELGSPSYGGAVTIQISTP